MIGTNNMKKGNCKFQYDHKFRILCIYTGTCKTGPNFMADWLMNRIPFSKIIIVQIFFNMAIVALSFPQDTKVIQCAITVICI